MTLIDEDRRRRALTELGSTLLVEAAAGTGKTSLMAGRVAMLLASGCEPKHIAAITFTELAASELSLRIHVIVEALLAGETPKVLGSALPNGLSVEQTTALAAAAHRLDELTASTIHGFCQEMIRSYAIDTDLDPGSRVIDGPGADAMFESVFSTWLISRLSGEAAADDPIAVLSKDDPLKVVATLKELADLKREHPTARTLPIRLDGRADIDFVQAVDDFARWFSGTPGERKTAEIVGNLQTLASFYSGAFETRSTFEELWRLGHPPRVNAMKARSFDLAPYQCKTAWKEVGGAEMGDRLNAEAEGHFSRIDIAYRTLLGQIAERLVASLSDALDEVLLNYGARKRAAAVLDFDDLILRAHDLVTNHEEVRQALGRRYRHIFVDEFQDTDPIQAAIIFLLAAESRPDCWQDARIRPGSLFLVGDPKQAIYRFRGADIGAYNQARVALAALAPDSIIQVTANFRSREDILKHVNACFEQVLSADNQPGYVPLTHTVDDAEHGLPCAAKITVDLPPDPARDPQRGPSADEQRDMEAEAVANICRRLVGSIEVTRQDGSCSLLKPGDIALLAPTRTDLWRYERALEAERLSVASQAGKTLLRRQETQDVLALLRLLADPFDTLAFGAFMRGPLVGLTDEELLDITEALRATGEEGTEQRGFTILTSLDDVTHPLAKAVLGVLQELRRRAAVTTPMILLSETAERLHLRVLLAARYGNRNARALANLDALIEMSRPYGVAGLRAFVQDLQGDWERQTPRSEGRIDASADAIEIVTIHSSKGLEWPVVIPINTATLLRSPSQFVHRQSDNTLHWVLGGVAPPDLAEARAEEGLSETLERERMWYVACTRARDILIIPHLPSASSRSWSRILDLGHSRLPEFDLAELPEAAVIPAPLVENSQTKERFAIQATAVAASAPALIWRRPSDHDSDRAQAFEVAPSAIDGSVQSVELVGAGRLRGILLHKLMEEFLTGELREDDREVEARAKLLLDQLTGMELTLETTSPDPIEIAATALRTLRSAEIARLRPQLMAEAAVWSGSDETGFVAGRADAVAVDDGRVIVVLDWKSDVSPTTNDRAGYAGQLGEYLAATGALRGALVYMSLGETDWVTNGQELAPG